jgi:predicted Zn-dependent protease
LLAPAGEVDKVLDTVVQNLIVTNGIQLDIRCRVLLTTPLETFSIGQAIVISRGLLDVLPDEASLAMVLSAELAHIVLGHRTETMYAFSDQTMFADEEILERLRLSRTPEEMAAASRQAVEILARSPYREKLSNAGLFLKALAGRAPVLSESDSSESREPVGER